MRLWSLHPAYLDAKGLTACWREGLLARKVLLGETKGYRHHPQLIRFRATADPVKALDNYLRVVLAEAHRRGYRFDVSKIGAPDVSLLFRMSVSQKQLDYEWDHLKRKLKQRNPAFLHALEPVRRIEPHPGFDVTEGPIASWEQVSVSGNASGKG